jgi:regulator of RNase E activity RraA
VSKSHPEQWTVHEVAERPERSLVTALREFATTQIADCGGPVGVVGPPLRHLAGGPQLCGPAVTVWTKPGDILYVLKATDLIADGDVLVVDGGGRLDAAVIGDIAGQALADLGCDGLVVDGAVRDLDGLDAAGLATFAAGAHPATGSNQGPGAINVVVQCGGVTVRPGDVVRGDASGLVVVPRGAGDDPHRRHRRSQPKGVIWIGRQLRRRMDRSWPTSADGWTWPTRGPQPKASGLLNRSLGTRKAVTQFRVTGFELGKRVAVSGSNQTRLSRADGFTGRSLAGGRSAYR